MQQRSGAGCRLFGLTAWPRLPGIAAKRGSSPGKRPLMPHLLLFMMPPLGPRGCATGNFLPVLIC
jgi:hypothetical protein